MITKCEACAKEQEHEEDTIMYVCKCGYINEIPFIKVK